MKFLILLVLISTQSLWAETSCDIRPGTSLGIKVVEFASGHQIHSKMPMAQTSAEALLEEMTSLQDMGVCEEQIIARKCEIRVEKQNFITLYRGNLKWNTWRQTARNQVVDFVRRLKKAGFCS